MNQWMLLLLFWLIPALGYREKTEITGKFSVFYEEEKIIKDRFIVDEKSCSQPIGPLVHNTFIPIILNLFTFL